MTGDMRAGSPPRTGRSSRSVASAVSGGASVADDLGTLLYGRRAAARPIRFSSVVLNLLNTAMGAGILSLATAIDCAGVPAGVSVIVLGAAAMVASVALLLRTARATNVRTYEDLAERCMGKWGRLWVQLALLTLCVGGCCAYLVAAKGLIHLVLKQVISDDAWASAENHGLNHQTCLLMGLVFGVPLALMPRIDYLAYPSIMSLAACVFFTGLTFVAWEHGGRTSSGSPCHELTDLTGLPATPAETPSEYTAPEFLDWFDAVPHDAARMAPRGVFGLLQAANIVAFSFCIHSTIFPIFAELRAAEAAEAATAKLHGATHVAAAVVTVCYIVAALFSYLRWREVSAKPSSVLACYDPAAPSNIAAQSGMIFVVLCSFPIIFHACRSYVASAIDPARDPSEPLPLKRHLAYSAALLVPICAVGFTVSSLSLVLSFASAITYPSLQFLLPGLCFLLKRRQLLGGGVTAGGGGDHGEEGGGCAPGAERARLIADSVADHGDDAERKEAAAAEAELLRGGDAAAWVIVVAGAVLQVAGLLAACISASGV